MCGRPPTLTYSDRAVPRAAWSYPCSGRGRSAARRVPELEPRFSRLKIVCGSFGTVPGLGMFVGFAGVGESLRG
jgi:hypothetical protein